MDDGLRNVFAKKEPVRMAYDRSCGARIVGGDLPLGAFYDALTRLGNFGLCLRPDAKTLRRAVAGL